MHQVERGMSRPSVDILNLIAHKTGKPMAYFLRSGRSDGITGAELGNELSKALKLVTEVIRTERLGASTRQSMQLVAGSLRRALALAKLVEGVTTPDGIGA